MFAKGLVGTVWDAGGVLCKVHRGERVLTISKLTEVFLLFIFIFYFFNVKVWFCIFF